MSELTYILGGSSTFLVPFVCKMLQLVTLCAWGAAALTAGARHAGGDSDEVAVQPRHAMIGALAGSEAFRLTPRMSPAELAISKCFQIFSEHGKIMEICRNCQKYLPSCVCLTCRV